MPSAVFDYNLWSRRYPELVNSTPASLASLLFDEAGDYLDNTENSLVTNLNQRLRFLNMLVAHLAALRNRDGLVGRINSATEGSVTVSTDALSPPGSGSWYQQTSYGAQFWALTAGYRIMRYYGPC